MEDASGMERRLMRKAIELSIENVRSGRGGPFAALVAKDGEIVATGTNLVTTTFDPTAHAEVVAIREACRALSQFQLTGCEIYTSCEPCPMCLGAIYWARFDRVYYANTRKDAAAIGFDDDRIYGEFAKPMATRCLPFVHLPLGEAAQVFKEWMAKSDKIPY
jgi:guanine deaminase